MAMPTNSKTWVFDVNNEVNTGAADTDMKAVLLAFKNFLVTVGGTVVRSCDSVSVSNGDEWANVGDLVWSLSGARSWAVVRMPAVMGANLDVLLECKWPSSATPCALVAYFSAEGYNLATGNTTTLPSVTAGTQGTLSAYGTGAVTEFIPKTTVKKIWNGAYSSDSKCIRFWVCSEGLCTTYVEIAELKNPVSDLAASNDFIIIWRNLKQDAAANVPTYAIMYTGATSVCNGYIVGTGIITYSLSGEARAGSTTPATNQFTAVPNPQDGNAYPILPIGVWSNTDPAYAYGRHGEVFDLWWAPSNLVNGSTFPGDGSKTHIVLGNAFVVPWDIGVVPVIT